MNCGCASREAVRPCVVGGEDVRQDCMTCGRIALMQMCAWMHADVVHDAKAATTDPLPTTVSTTTEWSQPQYHTFTLRHTIFAHPSRGVGCFHTGPLGTLAKRIGAERLPDWHIHYKCVRAGIC